MFVELEGGGKNVSVGISVSHF